MEEQDLRYRLYGLVPFSLSGRQMGIQFGHGAVEFMLKYAAKREVSKWATEDKTFIMLNGGTTNNIDEESAGTLNKHYETLLDNRVEVAVFHEPDLGHQLTSVNFLVDERVWDKEKYPDRIMGGSHKDGNMALTIYIAPESEESYERRLGGKKNVFLREFLRKFRLA